MTYAAATILHRQAPRSHSNLYCQLLNPFCLHRSREGLIRKRIFPKPKPKATRAVKGQVPQPNGKQFYEATHKAQLQLLFFPMPPARQATQAQPRCALTFLPLTAVRYPPFRRWWSGVLLTLLVAVYTYVILTLLPKAIGFPVKATIASCSCW